MADYKKDNDAAIDPSNTSSVGQKVEQGIITANEGITEQSSEWEDRDERDKNQVPQPSSDDDSQSGQIKVHE